MLKTYAKLSSLAITKAVLLYLGYKGGTYLDSLWGSNPWGLVFGLTLATGLGIWILYRSLEGEDNNTSS